MMEESDEDEKTYKLRRTRTTLPRSSGGLPPYTRSHDDGTAGRVKQKGKKKTRV